MNLKILGVFLATTILFADSALGQVGRDFFVVGSDTTYCDSLTYRQFGDRRVIYIGYTDAQGSKVELDGKENIPDVMSFHIDGAYFDKNPFKPDQRGKNYRYDKRYVDGNLKVYLDANVGFDTSMVVSTISRREDQVVIRSSPNGQYRFLIKMPDGKYYRANSQKDIRQFIVPFLNQCPEFVRAFNGSLDKIEHFAQPRLYVWDKTWGTTTKDEQNFMQAIALYNSLCK